MTTHTEVVKESPGGSNLNSIMKFICLDERKKFVIYCT